MTATIRQLRCLSPVTSNIGTGTAFLGRDMCVWWWVGEWGGVRQWLLKCFILVILYKLRKAIIFHNISLSIFNIKLGQDKAICYPWPQ